MKHTYFHMHSMWDMKSRCSQTAKKYTIGLTIVEGVCSKLAKQQSCKGVHVGYCNQVFKVCGRVHGTWPWHVKKYLIHISLWYQAAGTRQQREKEDGLECNHSCLSTMWNHSHQTIPICVVSWRGYGGRALFFRFLISIPPGMVLQAYKPPSLSLAVGLHHELWVCEY